MKKEGFGLFISKIFTESELSAQNATRNWKQGCQLSNIIFWEKTILNERIIFNYRMIGFLLLVFYLTTIKCYPSGAPQSACENMSPQHGVQPQSTSPPFNIITSEQYSPGVPLQGDLNFRIRSIYLDPDNIFSNYATVFLFLCTNNFDSF